MLNQDACSLLLFVNHPEARPGPDAQPLSCPEGDEQCQNYDDDGDEPRNLTEPQAQTRTPFVTPARLKNLTSLQPARM